MGKPALNQIFSSPLLLSYVSFVTVHVRVTYKVTAVILKFNYVKIAATKKVQK